MKVQIIRLGTIIDSSSENSVATRLRQKRFQILLNMLKDLQYPVTILDVGGRQGYWELMTGYSLNDNLHITLLNLKDQAVSLPNFTAILGDGRAMPQFSDKQFDIVFSNSTIEHVGTFEDQKQMAKEVRRVGKRYYVQTPNRYFLIEPHFIFPCFQFFPLALKVWLLQHFNLGWHSKTPDRQMAMKEVARIRLLTKTELNQLFPESIIFEEIFCGMAKSFVAYTPQ